MCCYTVIIDTLTCYKHTSFYFAFAVDYAHLGPAFITWHRQFNLWFEYEVQWMLQRMGRPDYHTYRSPYFDWRKEIQEGSGVKIEDILVESRFGFTNFTQSGRPVVSGPMVEGWESVCANMRRKICNPNVPTGPVQRCPLPDRCRSDNPDWPTLERVNRAISFETFDAAPWTAVASDGFRSFVDFEIDNDVEACRNDRMCLCSEGDINCTSPAIAAGAEAVTMFSRMHTTVSSSMLYYRVELVSAIASIEKMKLLVILCSHHYARYSIGQNGNRPRGSRELLD